MKRTQWFKRGDHPNVRHPKEGHLQPCDGLRNCGFLPMPNGEVLIREGDWIIEDNSGVLSLELASEADLAKLGAVSSNNKPGDSDA
jgi:hypothetical protein